MVALGATIKATAAIPLELIESEMVGMLNHKDSANIIAVNQQALDAGYSAARDAPEKQGFGLVTTCLPLRSCSS